MSAVRRGPRLRSLNEPRSVQVRADDAGTPLAIGRPDASERVHLLPVEAHRERWRIDDEWWRQPISRVYHTVVIRGGRLVTLYRDLHGGGWYLQD